jgi:hypothetical protein
MLARSTEEEDGKCLNKICGSALGQRISCLLAGRLFHSFRVPAEDIPARRPARESDQTFPILFLHALRARFLQLTSRGLKFAN